MFSPRMTNSPSVKYLRSRIAELEDQLEEKKIELKEQTTNAASLESKNKILNAKVKELESAHHYNDIAAEKTDKELADLRRELEQKELTLQGLKTDYAKLVRLLETKEAALHSFEENKDASTQLVQGYAKKLRDATEEIETLSERAQYAERKAGEMQRILEEKTAELHEMIAEQDRQRRMRQMEKEQQMRAEDKLFEESQAVLHRIDQLEAEHKKQMEECQKVMASIDKDTVEKAAIQNALTEAERKSYDHFLELSKARNENDALVAKIQRYENLVAQLKGQVQAATEAKDQSKEIERLQRQLKDKCFSFEAYISELKRTHEKEKQQLKEEMERRLSKVVYQGDENTPPAELPFSSKGKAIENEFEPQSSRATTSARNRSSIAFGQSKYDRLNDLNSRNERAAPHLRDSYFIDAQSPTMAKLMK